MLRARDPGTNRWITSNGRKWRQRLREGYAFDASTGLLVNEPSECGRFWIQPTLNPHTFRTIQEFKPAWRRIRRTCAANNRFTCSMWQLDPETNPLTNRSISVGSKVWLRQLRQCAQHDLCSAWAITQQERNPRTGRLLQGHRSQIRARLVRQCGQHPTVHFVPPPLPAPIGSSDDSSSDQESESENDQEIDMVLNSRDKNQAVGVERENIELTVSDVQVLKPRGWLSDEVINYMIAMIREEDRPRSDVMMSTFFYTKLMGGNDVYSFERVQRWWRRLEPNRSIGQIRRVFIPMHINNNHWILAVIDMPNHQILQYDSHNSNNEIHHTLLEPLKRWVSDQSGHSIDASSWPIIAQRTPQQQNGFDCGVFLLIILRRLINNQPLNFTQADIPNTRRQIVADIIHNQLSF
jgi:hypothetical protein